MFENEKNIFDNDYTIDLNDENGNSVIDATFAVTTAMFMVALIVMFGFYYYQAALLQTVADEVSTGIARTYSYSSKDPVSGFIGRDNFADSGLVNSSYWILGNLDSKNEKEKQEAKSLARQLLARRRFLAASGETKIDVEIGHSELALFQNEVKVTISEDYYIPFGKFFGVENSILSVKKSSKAMCYDTAGAEGYYQIMMEFADLVDDTKINKVITNFTGLIKNFKDAFDNVVWIFFRLKQK